MTSDLVDAGLACLLALCIFWLTLARVCTRACDAALSAALGHAAAALARARVRPGLV